MKISTFLFLYLNCLCNCYCQFFSVSGKVLAQHGVIGSATVRIAPKPPEDKQILDFQQIPNFESRAVDILDGSFRFPQVRAGQYVFQALHGTNAFLPACGEATLGPAKTGIFLELKNPVKYPYDGILVDKTGKPLPRTKIRITARCFDWASKEGIQMTDSKGHFNFPDLLVAPDHAYAFEAEVPDAHAAPVQGKSKATAGHAFVNFLLQESEVSKTRAVPEQDLENKAKKTIRQLGVFEDASSSLLRPRTDKISPRVWEVDPENNRLLPHGLTVGEKLTLHAQRMIDPSSFVFTGLVAAVNQARNDPSEWGGGTAGYARRFGSAFGYYSAIQNILSFSVDSALRMDPRYFRSSRLGAVPRLADCLKQTFLTKTDRGTTTFNVWRLVSVYGAGFISNSWNPQSVNTPERAVIRGSLSLGLDSAANVYKEFRPNLGRLLLRRKPGPQAASAGVSRP